MAHTEECRGCSCENRCDFIRCTKEIEKEIRAKAIDEFVEALRLKCIEDTYNDVHLSQVFKIAEQMKEGAE